MSKSIKKPTNKYVVYSVVIFNNMLFWGLIAFLTYGVNEIGSWLLASVLLFMYAFVSVIVYVRDKPEHKWYSLLMESGENCVK